MDFNFTNLPICGNCLIDEILLLLSGYLFYFVITRISHFIKARRGNPQKYWEHYWAAKALAEEEKLKDPSYKAQLVWDKQEERNRDSQRQIARELITATGRYKNRSPMTTDEILNKIQAEEWPFSMWMLTEYLNGSLLNDNPTYVQRIRRWITEALQRDF
jgi:hypothetical protein